MSQYKPHPFVLALGALCPILYPSFTLRSARDGEPTPEDYPIIDYIIIAGQSKIYNPSTGKFRSNMLIQVDFLVKETDDPLSWCEYDELKDAQDRQGLFKFMEDQSEEFLKLLIDPRKSTDKLNEMDMIYSQYEFKLENYISTNYHNKKGAHKLTGISIVFVLSALSDRQTVCCFIDNTEDQWRKVQDITKENSVSWKKIDKILNP